jgi:hypothetical protein
MKRSAALIVGLTMMLATSSALAQSSTCQAHNPQLCSVSGGTEAATSGVASSETLPFTGLDIGLLAVGGGVLVAGGGVVRSRVRRQGAARSSEATGRAPLRAVGGGRDDEGGGQRDAP